jgi:hypothetical protein
MSRFSFVLLPIFTIRKEKEKTAEHDALRFAKFRHHFRARDSFRNPAEHVRHPNHGVYQDEVGPSPCNGDTLERVDDPLAFSCSDIPGVSIGASRPPLQFLPQCFSIYGPDQRQ